MHSHAPDSTNRRQVTEALLTLARCLPIAFDSPYGADIGPPTPDLTEEINQLQEEVIRLRTELAETKRLYEEVLYQLETAEIVRTTE